MAKNTDAKPSQKSIDRKTKNREKNQAQHEANLAALKESGISPRISSITRLKHDRNGIPLRDKKGSTVTYTKKYEVRPSVLLNAEKRAQAGLRDKWIEAATRSGLKPAEAYSTAEHLEAAARKQPTT
jgi:hypothetical protein